MEESNDENLPNQNKFTPINSIVDNNLPDLFIVSQSLVEIQVGYLQYGSYKMNTASEFCKAIDLNIGLDDCVITNIRNFVELIEALEFMFSQGYNFENSLYTLFHTLRIQSKNQEHFKNLVTQKRELIKWLHERGAIFNFRVWNKQTLNVTKFFKLPKFVLDYTSMDLI